MEHEQSIGRAVKLSHPDGERLNQLANQIAVLQNPQLFYNIQDIDVNDPQYKAMLTELNTEMTDLLEGGSFRDEFPDLF